MTETLNTTKPDQEFLKFAAEFSKGFQVLPIAVYSSDHKQYSIKYCEDLIDERTNKPIQSDIRVSAKGMRIQLSKHRVDGSEYYTENYIYFLLIWCWFRAQVNTDFEADELAVKYYLTEGRPAKDVNLGFIETIRIATINIETNKKRLEKIVKLL